MPRCRSDLAVAKRTAYPVKAAALCIATILATPFTFDYDMMVLAPAIAFFAVDGLVRDSGLGRKQRWRRSGSCRWSPAVSRS